jgi:serine/threonine-protein kinase
VTDPALPELLRVIEAADGPLLVYAWVDGELLHRSAAGGSAFARFRALEPSEQISALDAVFRLHVRLAGRGWIASDFYDGCLIYDFGARRIHVVDLDNYRDAPFTNEMGRMFGSTRFMAPEEHERGARIDEQTTVFAMGRAIQQLLPATPTAIASVAERACASERRLRFASMAEFHATWSAASGATA